MTQRERLLTLLLEVKTMELDNARAAVAAYEGLVQQLVNALANQASAGVDPTAVQALADHISAINTSFQTAIASIVQKA